MNCSACSTVMPTPAKHSRRDEPATKQTSTLHEKCKIARCSRAYNLWGVSWQNAPQVFHSLNSEWVACHCNQKMRKIICQRLVFVHDLAVNTYSFVLSLWNVKSLYKLLQTFLPVNINLSIICLNSDIWYWCLNFAGLLVKWLSSAERALRISLHIDCFSACNCITMAAILPCTILSGAARSSSVESSQCSSCVRVPLSSSTGRAFATPLLSTNWSTWVTTSFCAVGPDDETENTRKWFVAHFQHLS